MTELRLNLKQKKMVEQAKSVLIPLALTAAALATDMAI